MILTHVPRGALLMHLRPWTSVVSTAGASGSSAARDGQEHRFHMALRSVHSIAVLATDATL